MGTAEVEVEVEVEVRVGVDVVVVVVAVAVAFTRYPARHAQRHCFVWIGKKAVLRWRCCIIPRAARFAV